MGELLSINSDVFRVFPMPEDGSNFRHMIVLHPTFAKQLANAGFSRQSFIQWLYNTNVIDWDQMSAEQQVRFKSEVAEGRFPGLQPADCKSGLHREPFSDPENVAVLVCGSGAGGVLIFQTMCGSTAAFEDVSETRPYMRRVIHGATLTQFGR
jgi:hypothetical protein